MYWKEYHLRPLVCVSHTHKCGLNMDVPSDKYIERNAFMERNVLIERERGMEGQRKRRMYTKRRTYRYRKGYIHREKNVYIFICKGTYT